MNLSPVKSWATGETLTASDLNSEYLNIYNHQITTSDMNQTTDYVFGGVVVGSGITSPDGELHIHSASAGSVSASGDGDELVLENSSTTGLTIFSGTSGAGNIFFGDSGDNDIGKISYSHSSNALTFTTNTTTALTLSSSQQSTFSGLVTANVGAEVKNGSSSAGFVKFYEDSDNGSNAVTLIGPSSTADVTLTLPASTDTLVGKATTDTLTNKTLTSAVLNTGVSGTAVLDEDNMASDSATKLATQQSIKAYVDASGSGTIGGTLGSTDNAVPRANGTGAATLQASSVLIDDSNNITGVVNLTASGELDGATLDISGDADIDGTTNLDAVDIDGATQIDGTVTVGVDDTGYDVKFFGATSGSSVLFDESADDMILTNYGLAVGSDSEGDLYYRNSSGFLARLGKGTAGHFLKQGSSIPEWSAVSGTGVGDFSGPGSATDNAIVRFDGTGGKTGQNSGVTIDDSNNATGFANVTLSGELDAGSLDVSGNADIDGTLEADAITLDGTALGSLYQALDADLTAIAGLSNSDGNFIVGSASGWVAESGSTVRTSLGLGTMAVAATGDYSVVAGSSSIVTTGALNSGSITSGFGNINIGSSTITTTGALASGATTVTGTLAVGNGATSAGKIEIYEDTDDGAHKLTLTTPSLASDVTLTFPNSDGDADQILTTNGSGALSWTTPSSGGASLSGSTATTIPTVTGSNALAGEANLRYDDKILSTDGASASFDTTMTGIQCEKAFFGGEDGHATNSEWWSNVYYDSSAYKRIGTGEASRYRQQSGTHTWYGAGSASADATITWTTLSYWDSSGNVDFYASGGTAFSVGTSTPRKPSGGDWTASSDSRLKNVVGEYTLGLTEICNSNVRPVKYQYNGKADTTADSKTYVGLIAQEVEQVFPDTVIQYSAKMNESDANETTDLRMFDAGEIKWALVNAVKELKAELDSAKARIAVLEGS